MLLSREIEIEEERAVKESSCPVSNPRLFDHETCTIPMCYKRALEKCFAGITVSFKTNRIRLFSFGCVREELKSPVLGLKTAQTRSMLYSLHYFVQRYFG